MKTTSLIITKILLLLACFLNGVLAFNWLSAAEDRRALETELRRSN